MTDAEIILSCQRQGMKLIEIAEKIGVSTSYLTAIKRGEREFGGLRREVAVTLLKSFEKKQQSCSITAENNSRIDQIEAELTILKCAVAQLAARVKDLETKRS